MYQTVSQQAKEGKSGGDEAGMSVCLALRPGSSGRLHRDRSLCYIRRKPGSAAPEGAGRMRARAKRGGKGGGRGAEEQSRGTERDKKGRGGDGEPPCSGRW